MTRRPIQLENLSPLHQFQKITSVNPVSYLFIRTTDFAPSFNTYCQSKW